PRYNKTGSGSRINGEPIPKLANQRWKDHLGRDEARDVIRAAKGGDPAARERLVKCYQKKIIAHAARYVVPAVDERVAAGWVRLWKALARYDLKRNNGLIAYAWKFIDGEIADYVTNWHFRGLKNESRLARKNRTEHRPVHAQYNGIESTHDDDDKNSHTRSS